MKQKMEKISILSLSLILISTYSVSAALPAMQEYYTGYSRAAVEQLVSITSFAMVIVIILNTWLTKFLSQRFCIILGIILLTAGGSAPMVIQNYGFVLSSRILLGVGIGLVNTHAITLINERYEGEERAALLGYRSAAEVLGNAVLTLIAGWLLGFGWSKAFAVYLAGLLILVLYLGFVPKQRETAAGASQKESVRMADVKKYAGFLCGTLALGFLVICINSCVTMRIPAMVLEREIGTEAQSSIVLSLMMVMGIAAGIGFGRLVQIFGNKLMGICLLVQGIGLVIISGSDSMAVMAAGAMISGLVSNLLSTIVFHRVSEALPGGVMRIGTTCGLVGCNLGAFASPYFMKLVAIADERSHAPLVVLAVLTVVLSLILLAGRKQKRKESRDE